MDRVTYGKQWEINSREDYDKAMEILDGNEFIADMSDDFSCWQKENDEVINQRHQVRRQAIAKGIITDDEDRFRTWRSVR